MTFEPQRTELYEKMVERMAGFAANREKITRVITGITLRQLENESKDNIALHGVSVVRASYKSNPAHDRQYSTNFSRANRVVL